jgi:hypothetical protein
MRYRLGVDGDGVVAYQRAPTREGRMYGVLDTSHQGDARLYEAISCPVNSLKEALGTIPDGQMTPDGEIYFDDGAVDLPRYGGGYLIRKLSG